MSSLPQVEDSSTWRKNPPSESRLGHHEHSKLVKPLEKLEVSLTPDLLKRIDEVVELLGFKDRKELVTSSIQRFLDKYPIPEPKNC